MEALTTFIIVGCLSVSPYYDKSTQYKLEQTQNCLPQSYIYKQRKINSNKQDNFTNINKKRPKYIEIN